MSRRVPNAIRAAMASPAVSASVHRGVVVSVDQWERVWVTVGRLTNDEPVGPLPTVVMPRPLAPGDRVVVQSVEGRREDLIVTGLLHPHDGA